MENWWKWRYFISFYFLAYFLSFPPFHSTERYDYIFLTSSGDAVSVQWDGNINWYAHTAASWTATPLSNNEQPNVWSFGSEVTVFFLFFFD